jgi:SAM-dependent methyltransferase
MNLLDIVRRNQNLLPWEEGEKIAWDDPAFSERILKEHLSQEHDEASRRMELIDAHVEWIHNTLLKGRSAQILDLCCGPGLYTSRLTKLGHRCTGIDFSPAAIHYARTIANEEGSMIDYAQNDVRRADYGKEHDLVMMLFGEINVFRKAELLKILQKAKSSLSKGGTLLLEAHTFEAVQNIGEGIPFWYSEESGLFSDKPHICLIENFWNEEKAVATVRYHIIDAATGTVNRQAWSTQAYTEDEYEALLRTSGFSEIIFHKSFGEVEDDNFLLIEAKV